jgi:hypothetical protein
MAVCRAPSQSSNFAAHDRLNMGTDPMVPGLTVFRPQGKWNPILGDAGRISGLPGLPAVLISGLESGLRIPGLSGFEFLLIQFGLYRREGPGRCEAVHGHTAALSFVALPGRADPDAVTLRRSIPAVSIVPRVAGEIWKTLIRRGVADSGIRNRNAQMI